MQASCAPAFLTAALQIQHLQAILQASEEVDTVRCTLHARHCWRRGACGSARRAPLKYGKAQVFMGVGMPRKHRRWL
jgi:hypothetical protein